VRLCRTELHITVAEFHTRKGQYPACFEHEHDQHGRVRCLPIRALTGLPDSFYVPLSWISWTKVKTNRIMRVLSGIDDAYGCDITFALVCRIIPRA
jgi:hypothetical protein